MRKYPIVSSNGKLFDASNIGVNHTIDGLYIENNISSYNREFDNKDEVCLSYKLDDIRYCILGDIKETYKILKEEIISKRPHNIEEYSGCVQRTITRYFGDYSKIRKRRSFFPTEEEVIKGKEIGKVSNLAHQSAAMSVERAMVAHNLLIEIGIKSTFKISEVLINGNIMIHGYNLVSHDGKYYVFDVSIPSLNNDKITPLICEIPEEVYDKIIKPNPDIGISILLSHYNPLQGKDYEVIYDIGREEVYQVGKVFTK